MYVSTYWQDNLVTDNFTNVEFYELEFIVELPEIIWKIPDVVSEVRVHPVTLLIGNVESSNALT